LEENNMNAATQKRSALNLRSDKLRLHGWAMGLVLLVASLLVASSMMAGINFILIAIPILTIAAVVAIFVAGIPMVAAGVEARREARDKALNEAPTILSLEGFWKHPQAWQRGHHPHFLGFQPIDHNIVIHLDSESDQHSMTMGEFMRMTSSGSSSYRSRELENTLEGVTNWRRV
jgi:hypothetical protein